MALRKSNPYDSTSPWVAFGAARTYASAARYPSLGAPSRLAAMLCDCVDKVFFNVDGVMLEVDVDMLCEYDGDDGSSEDREFNDDD